MKTFKILNVKCESCGTRIKSKLLEDFGEVDINLDVEPREITIKKENFDEEALKTLLKSLGYPMEDDDNCLITKTKSYISCMIGKIKK